jgi:methylmalonyl-CoA mutase, N-terminal domain
MGKDHARTLQGAEAVLVAVALPHTDGWLHAHRATARKQRRACDHASALRRARWDAISAHQFMDEALWLPTEKSVRVALRTQQIIAYESGVADSIDPLAGSYLIEYLTDEIEKGAEEYIAKIDEMGGAMQSIERGFMQNEIQNAAYAAQQAIEKKEQIIVGVNQFACGRRNDAGTPEGGPIDELGQREKLKKLREARDEKRVTELRAWSNAAKGTENLMPLFIECVENDITLGEICNTLRGVWGEYVAEGF